MNPHIPNTSSRTPAPTRASIEFPDDTVLTDLGIAGISIDEARIIAAALSHFIAAGRSKNRTKVAVMISMLVGSCQVEVVRDGCVNGPAMPNLPQGPWPHGKTVFTRLGIDHSDLEAYWRAAKNRADDACLPREWLLAWLPAPLWAALATVLRWGPYETTVRAEEATVVFAQTAINRGTRRRPEGSLLAAGTIENRVDSFWAFLRTLVDLRAKVAASKHATLSSDLLEAWSYVPDRVDAKACGAREAYLDTNGPPIEECAATLRRLHSDWQKAAPGRRYRALRRLVLQALLPLFGPRVDALRCVDVADYLPDDLGSDGVRGPILRIFPGKSRDHDEAYLLPLPPEVAGWVEEWIAYTGRRLGDDGPLWPGRKPQPGKPVTRISESGLYCAIAGREGTNGKGDSRALMPRADNPAIGYNPHAFRHTAYQAAKRAGVTAKQANPVEFGHVDQEDFARAVCGHSLKQSLKDAYLNPHQLRLARAAVQYAWAELWGGGKRHGLDPRAILQHTNEVRILCATAHELERDITTLRSQQEELARASATMTGHALHAAAIESNRIASEIQLRVLDLNRTFERQRAAEERLAEARTTHVPLPDDLSDEEHARLLAAVLENATETHAVDGDHTRADDLMVADLAELFGTSDQTINAWVRNGFPRGRPAAWNPDAWIVEGLRKKRLPVSALNRSLLSEVQTERLDVILRRRATLLEDGQPALLSA